MPSNRKPYPLPLVSSDQERLWWLQGCLAQTTGRSFTPSQTPLKRQYEQGKQDVRAGRVQVREPAALAQYLKNIQLVKS